MSLTTPPSQERPTWQGAGERVLVLGAGESGTGAARLAAAHGLEVIVSEGGTIPDSRRAALVVAGIPFEEGAHTEGLILKATCIVKSPGIAPTQPLVAQALGAGIPVIDEIEFCRPYLREGTELIGITGSNGKTTTTLLTYHLLREGGLDVGLAGNIGQSLAGQLADGLQHKWWVLELSSFQLEGIWSLPLKIGMLLNLSPDHLDRYKTMARYAEAKMRLARLLDERAHLIYGADDELFPGLIQQEATCMSWHTFGLGGAPMLSAGLLPDGGIEARANGLRVAVPAKSLPLPGPHNQRNTQAALLAALLAGVSPEALLGALPTFEGAPHRLERVGEIDSIPYINDSKATNPDSVRYALEAFADTAGIVWIAGGKDKGNDYALLRPLVERHVRALICMTRDPAPLQAAFGDLFGTLPVVESAEDAIAQARQTARPGQVVLLSPACASFDLFRNYEHRGEAFREAVRQLQNSEAGPQSVQSATTLTATPITNG